MNRVKLACPYLPVSPRAPAASASRSRAALAVSLFLSSCAAPVPQGGAPMPNLSLVANGANLVFSWSKESPLARELRAGTSIELLAEYPTEAGLVTGERLTTGRVDSSMSVQLPLPAGVRNTPIGPVCLRLRPAGRRSIPLRAAGGSTSTDGFQYAQWEQQTSRESRRRSLEAELSQVQTALSAEQASAASFAAWKQQRGLADVQACDRLTPSGSAERPTNVVEPSLQVAAARRECTWRLKHFAAYWDAIADKESGGKLRFRYTAGDISARAEKYFTEAAAKSRSSDPSGSGEMARLTQRATQASAMRSTYRDQDRATEAPFKPLLLAEPLSLTSNAQSALVEVIKAGGDLSPAFLTGVLDAFESCLNDSASQFKLSRERWLREQDPRLLASQVQALRGECRARFADEAKRVDGVARLDTRQRKLEGDLAGLPKASNEPLPVGVSLQRNACAMR